MRKIIYLCSLLCVLSLSGNALAYSISLVPSSYSIQTGESAQVDLNLIMAPGEELFGFNFGLIFDPAVLRFDNLVFGNGITTDYITGFTAPTVGLENLLTFDGALFALYGATTGVIPLASIYFTGLNIGNSSLMLNGSILDMMAFNEIQLSATGNVDVVPEPGTFLLLGTGLAALWAFRRKQSQRT